MLNPSKKFLSAREIKRNAVVALVISVLLYSATWCVFEVDALFEGSVFQDVRHLFQLTAVVASPLPIFLWLFMVATPIIDNWRLKSPINLSISRNRVRYRGAGRFAGKTGVVQAAEKQSFSSEAELIADPDHLGSLISQALCECNARLVPTVTVEVEWPSPDEPSKTVYLGLMRALKRSGLHDVLSVVFVGPADSRFSYTLPKGA